MGPRKRNKTNPPETSPSDIPLPDASGILPSLEAPVAVEIGASNTAEPEKADSDSVRICKPHLVGLHTDSNAATMDEKLV